MQFWHLRIFQIGMNRRLRQTKDQLVEQLVELENRQKNLPLHVGLVNQRKSLLRAARLVGQVSLQNQKRNLQPVAVRVGLENNFSNSRGGRIWQINTLLFNGILQMSATKDASTATFLQKATLLLFL